MDTRINNGMCRCCASEGTFKDLTSTYHWMGEAEVYADMLKECFDIILSKEEDCDDNGICEVCITQLRNASNFKKQVLHTEEQFKQRLQDKLFKTNIVKVELANTEEAIDSDNDNASEGYSGADFEVPIKVESLEEVKPKKRAAKASTTTTRAKKAKIDAGETSTKRAVIIKFEGPRIEPDDDNKESTMKMVTLNKTKILNQSNKKHAGKKTKSKKKKGKGNSKIVSGELEKYRSNVREILLNSNATPIRCLRDTGYACCFCTEDFRDPANLKKHTIEEHDISLISNYMKGSTTAEFAIKLDITKLKCHVCESNIETLEAMLNHLKNDHKKNVHPEVDNRILPFKFEGDTLKCCMCLNVFITFRKLQCHMSIHYPNYVCDVCDTGFVTKSKLVAHLKLHDTGKFKCDYCELVFDKLQEKRRHEYQHRITGSRKCGFCNEKFYNNWSKMKHLTEVHGIKKSVTCQACNKEYVTPGTFRTHMKKFHLMEKRYKCSLCPMEFFGRRDLDLHMVKHTGTREFRCNVCMKYYARQKSLSQHMKIHNNDRRFKCEYCGKAFVQKSSLKSHLKSKHGDYD